MIYVASSSRQPGIIQVLRAAGHEVYDFRAHGDFHWRDIDPQWESWAPADVAGALKHPIAQRSFACDMEALEACDALVLVMPCGRSAHLELGYAVGAGKRTAVLLDDGEPELMWGMADWIGADLGDLIAWLEAESRTPCVVGDEELARGEATPSEVDYATLLLGQPVPGKEAEELRQGIERLIADIAVDADPEDIAADLQRLLDETDARDALAYLEGQAPCSKRRLGPRAPETTSQIIQTDTGPSPAADRAPSPGTQRLSDALVSLLNHAKRNEINLPMPRHSQIPLFDLIADVILATVGLAPPQGLRDELSLWLQRVSVDPSVDWADEGGLPVPFPADIPNPALPCSNCGRVGEHDEICPVPREELLEEAAAIYHATRPTTAELLQRLRPGDTFLLSCKAAVGSAPRLTKAVLRHEEPSCPLADAHADPDVAARSVLIRLPRRT